MNFFLYSVAGAIVIVVASFLHGDRDKYPQVVLAVCFAVFALLINIPQSITFKLHPHTYDMVFYRLDLALHLDPLVLCRFVLSRNWLSRALAFCYEVLPLVAATLYSFERSRVLITAAAIAPAGALIGYNLFPAVGPAHAFAGFPWEPARMLPVVEGVARDCMPSMHLGWALILLWNVKHPILKAAAWIFVGLQVLATVGLGEHYYIDLIAAVPFSRAFQILAMKYSPPTPRAPKAIY